MNCFVKFEFLIAWILGRGNWKQKVKTTNWPFSIFSFWFSKYWRMMFNFTFLSNKHWKSRLWSFDFQFSILNENQMDENHTDSHYQLYSLLCLFVICVFYASIIVKICCGARPQHHGAARRQRKLTVTLLIMTIVSVLLWLPFTVATFVYHTTDSIRSLSYTKIKRLNMSLLLLFYTNSFVNPVVYTIRMPEFRKALLLLFTRRQRQNAAAAILLHAR